VLFGPDPLGEKLTLLWHDHFATAYRKVRDFALMRRQNDSFRRHARGKFAGLLRASVKEPAVLIYLDAPANRKGHANKNLARIEDVLLSDAESAKKAVGPPLSDELLSFVRRQAVDAQRTGEQLARLSGGGDAGRYPATGLAERLKLAARLLKTKLDDRFINS
jgi:hypothetical protein